MAKRRAAQSLSGRAELERLMSDDMRALTAQSDRINRSFARRHDISPNDLFALLHIRIAEAGDDPLTSSELRQRMDVSAAAVTYIVDRMIEAGHLRRDPDPTDRRKALLRYEQHGIEVSQAYFGRLRADIHSALAGLRDTDLIAAHQVFTAAMAAMSDFEGELRVPSPKQSEGNGQRPKR